MTRAPRVVSNHTLERATRECSTSPTITTCIPSRSIPVLAMPVARERTRRRVMASSRAWVGCACLPSPALITAASIHPESASCCGAPEDAWRITTASALMAMSVCAVSLSDSPLDTEEPLAEKLITSALSRLAAVSNEIRVRVESSKNRLTTVRPRRAGSFLTEREDTAAIWSAVSRIRTASG